MRSLTLIEPPLGQLVRGDPDVDELERMGDEVLTRGLDANPGTLRGFLSVSGATDFGAGPLPEHVARGVQRAHGGRLPRDAHIDVDALRRARIPTLVASGGHSTAIERICDVLADELRADRLIASGAGHFVAAAPGFAPRLERFLTSAG